MAFRAVVRTTKGRSARPSTSRNVPGSRAPPSSFAKTSKWATDAVSSSVEWQPRNASKIEVGSSGGGSRAERGESPG